MYDHILVALDGSEPSRYARQFAIAAATDARVTACHIYGTEMHRRRFTDMEPGLPAPYQRQETPSGLRRSTSSNVLLAGGVTIANGESRTVASGTVKVEGLGDDSTVHGIDIFLGQVGPEDVPHLRGIDEFRCEGNPVSAEFNGDPELPAQLLHGLTAHGGRVRSMEIRSMTLHEAVTRRAAQTESQS
jgi:hypothetical protein